MSQSHGPDTQTETLADPDDMRQRQRLEAIKQTREQAKEAMRDARHLYHMGEIGEESYHTLVRGGIEEYILELETLMHKLAEDDDTDLRYDYWDGVRVGTMRLPSGRVRHFIGLGDIVRAQDPLVDEWVAESTDVVGGTSRTQHRETAQIPLDVLKTAYRLCNQFLMDADLDFKFEKEGIPEWGFEEVHGDDDE